MINSKKNYKLITILLLSLFTFNIYTEKEEDIDDFFTDEISAEALKEKTTEEEDIDEDILLCVKEEAKSGNVEYQLALGVAYQYPNEVKDVKIKQDDKEGLFWLRKAEKNGCHDAKLLIGMSYYWGKGVKVSYKKAKEWIEKAKVSASCTQDPKYTLESAEDLLEMIHRKELNIERENAIQQLRRLAESGDVIAQCKLAKIYCEGDITNKNPEQAIFWFEKAANQGCIESCYYMGLIYDLGEFLEKDWTKAIAWYKKAALKNNINAQLNLGYLLTFEKMHKEGRFWLKAAYNNGNIEAAKVLADIYLEGIGCQPNNNKASKWLKLSKNKNTKTK